MVNYLSVILILSTHVKISEFTYLMLFSVVTEVWTRNWKTDFNSRLNIVWSLFSTWVFSLSMTMLNPFMDTHPSMGLKLSPPGITTGTAAEGAHHAFHHSHHHAHHHAAHHHSHHNPATQYHHAHHQIHQTNGYHHNPQMSYAAAHLLRSR